MIVSPWFRVLRTKYPDLAGVLMRDWQREGFLVRYRHGYREGFVIVAVRPRWQWVPRLVFRYWSEWPSLAATMGLVFAFVGFWLLGWFFFGAGQ